MSPQDQSSVSGSSTQSFIEVPVAAFRRAKSPGSRIGSWFSRPQQYSQGVTKVTKSFGDLLASKKELSRLSADKKDTTEQSAAVKKAHGIFRDDFDAVAFSEEDGYDKLVESIGRTYQVDEWEVQGEVVGVHTEWDN
jgi:hypothetical protein